MTKTVIAQILFKPNALASRRVDILIPGVQQVIKSMCPDARRHTQPSQSTLNPYLRSMRQHGLSLVLVLLAGSGAPIQALRQVVWTATTRQSLTAPPAFQQWFADDPAVPAQVLSAADALSDITALGENRFEARMSTTQFPFVTLQPMVILSCDRSADGTEVVVSAQPPFLHVTRGVRFDLKSSRWKFLGPRGCDLQFQAYLNRFIYRRRESCLRYASSPARLP